MRTEKPWLEDSTLPETNMETPKDYSPSKRGAIWVSMLVWESVTLNPKPGTAGDYRLVVVS